jgi:transposase
VKKNTYRSVEIQKVTAAQVLAAIVTPLVILALDVAKKRVLVAIAGASGQHAFLVYFAMPDQLGLLFALAAEIKSAGRIVQIVLEPTGSYGAPIVETAHREKIECFLVSPKRSHDAAEVYDGVPSKHDPKDATILARLHTQGLSRPWLPMAEDRREFRALVDERELYAGPLEEHFGRVEARLACWWPELLQLVEVRGRISVLRWLVTYADPAMVRASPQTAAQALRTLSRGMMEPATMDAIVASATRTRGAVMTPGERKMVTVLFEEIVRLHDRCAEVDARITQRIEARPDLAPMRQMLGAATLAVVLAKIGEPSHYSSASALEKACGLNLKESSSGERQGYGVHLTKRGPGVVRKYLYMQAMRQVAQNEFVRAWYQRRRSYMAGDKMSALTAVMRKQIKALWHVSRGATYDATKLFDLRRLGMAPVVASSAAIASQEVAAMV